MNNDGGCTGLFLRCGEYGEALLRAGSLLGAALRSVYHINSTDLDVRRFLVFIIVTTSFPAPVPIFDLGDFSALTSEDARI